MAKSKQKSTPRTAGKKRPATPKSSRPARSPSPVSTPAPLKLHNDVAENERTMAAISRDMQPAWEKLIADLHNAAKHSWPVGTPVTTIVFELICAYEALQDEPQDDDDSGYMGAIHPRSAQMTSSCFPAAAAIIREFEEKFQVSFWIADVRGDDIAILFMINRLDTIENARGKRDGLHFELMLSPGRKPFRAITTSAVYQHTTAAFKAMKKAFDRYWTTARQHMLSGAAQDASRIDRYIAAKEQLAASIAKYAETIVRAAIDEILTVMRDHCGRSGQDPHELLSSIMAHVVDLPVFVKEDDVSSAAATIRQQMLRYSSLAGMHLDGFYSDAAYVNPIDVGNVIVLMFHFEQYQQALADQLGSFPKLVFKASVEPDSGEMVYYQLANWELLEKADLQKVHDYYKEQAQILAATAGTLNPTLAPTSDQ